MPMVSGHGWGSLYVLQNNGQGAGPSRLTKSVEFDDWIVNSENVHLEMEHELEPAERMAIFEGMHNIHPPAKLDAPNPRGAKLVRCREQVALLADRLRGLCCSQSTTLRCVRDANRSGQFVYYLRSGKIDPETCDSIVESLAKLPRGILLRLSYEIEWITDNVGGARLVFELDLERSEAYLSQLRSRRE
jgi:hypothetical protein